MGCCIWYSEEGPGRGSSTYRPLLAVPNVTAHPSTASVPITVSLYNGLFLCGFDVSIEGLRMGAASANNPLDAAITPETHHCVSTNVRLQVDALAPGRPTKHSISIMSNVVMP